ncbi:hypothetical protein D9M68_844620 [compost metagenome]
MGDGARRHPGHEGAARPGAAVARLHVELLELAVPALLRCEVDQREDPGDRGQPDHGVRVCRGHHELVRRAGRQEIAQQVFAHQLARHARAFVVEGVQFGQQLDERIVLSFRHQIDVHGISFGWGCVTAGFWPDPDSRRSCYSPIAPSCD